MGNFLCNVENVFDVCINEDIGVLKNTIIMLEAVNCYGCCALCQTQHALARC